MRIERYSAAYLEWLDALNEDALNSSITFPFGLGSATVEFALFAAARHTKAHIAQLEYVQTIYGDQDWHIGV